MNEMTIRKVRLLAERDGAELLQFPASLGRQLTDDGGLELIKGEDKLFQARRETLLGQRTLLQERITQIRDEIAGMQSQGKAIMHELELTTQELDALRDLKKRQLVSLDRYMPLERGAAKLQGNHGQIVSDIARARGRISEAELQILQLEKEFRESVLSDLGTVRVNLAELTERRIAAEDQLRRLEVRAPQSGIVHQLALHTRGGVIAPGQALMEIIPQDEGHIVEARIAPGDIDQVRQGQEAVVRFSAFNQRTTPQLNATLYSVSPDIAEDERSGETVLYRPAAPRQWRTGTSRRAFIDTRHACGRVHPDRRPQRHELSDKTVYGSVAAGISRRIARLATAFITPAELGFC